MSYLLEAVRGCTFDDFLFSPRFSVLERRDPRTIDLSSRFSEHLTLKHPIVSANMDTITRSAMAVVQAEEGGLGVIDRGFRGGDIAAQVREVEIVKRTQHGVIPDPYTVRRTTASPTPSARCRSRVWARWWSTDDARKLKGLLTSRDVRFVGGAEARQRADDAAREAGRSHRRDLARRGRAGDDRPQDQEAAARRRSGRAHRASSPPKTSSSRSGCRWRRATRRGGCVWARRSARRATTSSVPPSSSRRASTCW